MASYKDFYRMVCPGIVQCSLNINCFLTVFDWLITSLILGKPSQKAVKPLVKVWQLGK